MAACFTSLFVLVVVLFIASPTSIAEITISGKLVEFSQSTPQQQINGTYISHDGIHGIIFISKADGHLFIRNLDGERIVETGPFFEEDGKKLRSITIMGHEYLQHISSSHPDKQVDHDTPFSHAMQKLRGMKEIAYFIQAAEAIGAKGLTGKNTPAAMPFFMFAVRVTQLHKDLLYNTTSPRRTKRQSCFETCPPCPDVECYGMCGYGCWCWSFLCGDCCYHVGCFNHDTCCRQDFYQSRCLLPYDFKCEEYYF